MKKALELYLHIPFCIRKCEYCDFLSGPADERNRRTYLDALLRELAAVGPQAEDYEVTSVYIGGGTPSLLPGEWMEKLMAASGKATVWRKMRRFRWKPIRER